MRFKTNQIVLLAREVDGGPGDEGWFDDEGIMNYAGSSFPGTMPMPNTVDYFTFTYINVMPVLAQNNSFFIGVKTVSERDYDKAYTNPLYSWHTLLICCMTPIIMIVMGACGKCLSLIFGWEKESIEKSSKEAIYDELLAS